MDEVEAVVFTSVEDVLQKVNLSASQVRSTGQDINPHPWRCTIALFVGLGLPVLCHFSTSHPSQLLTHLQL